MHATKQYLQLVVFNEENIDIIHYAYMSLSYREYSGDEIMKNT